MGSKTSRKIKKQERKATELHLREPGKITGGALAFKAVSFLFTVFIVFLPLVFSRYSKSNFIMPKTWVYEPAMAFFLLLWGFSVVTGGVLSVLRTRTYAASLFFLIVCLLSVYVAAAPYESVKTLRPMIAAAVGGFLAANLVKTRLHVSLILVGMCAVGVIESFWGIAQTMGRRVLFNVGTEAVGTLGNSNYLGAFLGLLIPVALSLGIAAYNRDSPRNWRILMLAASIMAVFAMTTGLILTECQGAYLSTALAFVVMAAAWAVKSPGKRKILLNVFSAVILLSIVSIIAASSLGRTPVKRFAHLGDRAVGGRILMWEASMKMVADHPVLGIGIGNYHYLYHGYLSETLKKKDVPKIRHIIQNAEKPHNAYIQFWSELGTLGLLAFMALLAVFFAYRFVALYKIPDAADFWVHLGMVTGLMGFCALLFVSSVMGLAPMREYFWLFMGLAVAWEWIAQVPEKDVLPVQMPSGLNYRKAVGIVLFIIVPAVWFVSAVHFSNRHYKANVIWKNGIQASNSNQLVEAVALYDTALKFTPMDMKLLFYRGSAMIKLSEFIDDPSKRNEALLEGMDNLLVARSGYSDINMESNLGKSYSQIGDIQSALKHYRTAAETGLKYVEAHTNLGVALMVNGNYEEAKTELEKALDANKKSTRTKFFLGVTLLKLHEAEAAESIFRELTDVMKGDPNPYNNLGLALMEQDRIDEAIESFEKAVAADTRHTKSRNGLAAALWKAGKHKEAVLQWERVLIIDPNDTTAKKNLSQRFEPAELESNR